jgi:hypothetical protein
MNTLSKCCTRCKAEKPLTEFYIRSGYQRLDNSPVEPGHYNSECKACLSQRSKVAKRLPDTMPRTKNEILALTYLKKHGIPALPGKALAAADVDVVCYIAVWLEVKLARLERKGNAHRFTFETTPKQQQRGFLADVVMLICEYRPGVYTYHFFRPDHPVFYMQDRVKSGFTFTPGATKALKHGLNRVVMTQPMMDEARDRVSLIEEALQRARERLRSGETLPFEFNSRNK